MQKWLAKIRDFRAHLAGDQSIAPCARFGVFFNAVPALQKPDGVQERKLKVMSQIGA